MPFHCATENMAALLRSARSLKFSPSGLLQITGAKRNGPPLGRLYSGALGGRRTGVGSLQISPAAGNASSRVWPYALGCVRNYAVATELRDEAIVAMRSKQTRQFNWALAKLDSSVRRTGRITKTLLLRIFHDICRTGYPSSNQALLLLRSCGALVPEVSPEERTELAHRVWEKLQEFGAQYDVSHYNALLKVYLQNEFKFSPTDFLAKMEAANIEPNRVTYQRLIATYCHNGDIDGASTILGFMKSKDLPITETVFNSLLTGHARAGDMESAKNILSVMLGAKIEPGPDTYVSLLNAYAEKGDLDSLRTTLEAAESADCSLMDRDIMQVIFTLAKAGHHQHIPGMIERLRHERGYIPDAMNLCLSLITQGQEDTAFLILRTFPTLQSDGINSDLPNLGNFFLRHCVNMEMSVEKLGRYCKELQESNLHSTPLSFSLFCALEAKKTGFSVELMKMLKEQDFPIRPHYFWPLLTQHRKVNNIAGVNEVLKAMLELGVFPDVETLSTYILPVFPNMEAAEQALNEAGVSTESKSFLSSKVRTLAAGKLTELYTLLSDPSFPSFDLSNFRSSLVLGFRKSTDVETMVKITELLYKDERFSKENLPAEVAFFLYSLINSMPEMEVQEQQDKLQKFFNQLQTQNIMISERIYKGIRNLLSDKVPELIKDVVALVDPKDRVSNDFVSSVHNVGIEKNMFTFVEELAKLKSADKPTGMVLKQAIYSLSAAENLDQALELKQLYEEEMTVGNYAILISLCCHLNNLEEALNLKREMSRKDPSVLLTTYKYLALVKAFSNNGRVEEAVDFLKEMKEKEVEINDKHINMLFHMLSTMNGGAPIIRKLQDTIFSLGLAKPTANLCSPLITDYLKRNDLSGALEAALEFQKRYNTLPRIHDILVALVKEGDTELLQKAMDRVSQEQGEMVMMYNLFFAFVQTGRYREARKVIETPGLRAQPGRLQWYAEKCISTNQMETLEQLVDLTAKLFECDRDEMYGYVLRLCKKTNNWQKAEAMWMKMQEENIIPRDRTLNLLADILKENGQEVPFGVPETWYKVADTTKQIESAADVTPAESASEYNTHLMVLCKRGKTKEAFDTLMSANDKGVAIDSTSYDHLIRALLAKGLIEDAIVVKDLAASRVQGFHLSNNATNLLIITQSKKGQAKDALESLKSMLRVDQVPSQLAITRLVQGLGSEGNVAGIQELDSIMKGLGSNLSQMNMVFINNTALAHIENGDLESAVEVLEAVFTNPDSANSSISYIFRRLLENGNEKALDKLSAMAERLANQFACYRPCTDLFLQLLDMDKTEDAKFMLARCNFLAEQKEALLSFVNRRSQTPGQVGKIKTLLSLIPDFAEKEVLYAHLMKCHNRDKDLSSAKALYEQMQKEGIVAHELTLKRLAGLYHSAGETVPFPEPPESFKFYADKLRDNAQASAQE